MILYIAESVAELCKIYRAEPTVWKWLKKPCMQR